MRKLVLLFLFLVGCATPQVAEPVEEEYEGYVNEQYHFRNMILDGFDVVEGENEVVMTRSSEYVDNPDTRDEELVRYQVEIGVRASEVDYVNLADFLAKEYGGYSVEYLDDGVIVDEWLDDDSVRHFYTMRGEVLYDAYLRLPSVRFNFHLGGFEDFLRTVEFDF